MQWMIWRINRGIISSLHFLFREGSAIGLVFVGWNVFKNSGWSYLWVVLACSLVLPVVRFIALAITPIIAIPIAIPLTAMSNKVRNSRENNSFEAGIPEISVGAFVAFVSFAAIFWSLLFIHFKLAPELSLEVQLLASFAYTCVSTFWNNGSAQNLMNGIAVKGPSTIAISAIGFGCIFILLGYSLFASFAISVVGLTSLSIFAIVGLDMPRTKWGDL